MKITNINVRRTFNEEKLKAIVSVTIDNCLAVHDIKLIQGDTRLFVSMPNKKDSNGIFRDIIHPINSETRDSLESLILRAYEIYKEYEDLLTG